MPKYLIRGDDLDLFTHIYFKVTKTQDKKNYFSDTESGIESETDKSSSLSGSGSESESDKEPLHLFLFVNTELVATKKKICFILLSFPTKQIQGAQDRVKQNPKFHEKVIQRAQRSKVENKSKKKKTKVKAKVKRKMVHS